MTLTAPLKVFLWTAPLVSALVLVSSNAVAQAQRCSDREQILGLLAKQYKEAPVAVGVTNTGELLEVLTSGDGQTWTIIYSTPDGQSCLVAAGEGWRPLEADAGALDPQV